MRNVRSLLQQHRRSLWWAAGGLAGALLLWLALTLWYAYQTQLHLRSLQRNVATTPLTSAQAAQICVDTRAVARSLNALTTLTWPLRWLVPALGWLPRYGATLTQAPFLLSAAQAGANIGPTLCHALAPIFPAIDARRNGADQAAVVEMISPALQQAGPDLQTVAEALTRLDTSFATIEPAQLADGPLARYAALLQTAKAHLPEARAALATVQKLLPIGLSALQAGKPQRYLILAQNSSELRATGGYMGTVGTILVGNGQVTMEQFGNVFRLKTAAPPEVQLPNSIPRYLRLTDFWFQDTNWHADFPTNIPTMQYVWSLNRQPPFDGVVAVDIYALAQFIEALGALDVQGYGHLDGQNSIEQLYDFYYNRGTVRYDKGFIKALLDAALERLQHIKPSDGLALIRAAERVLDERHVLVWLADPKAQALLHVNRWDGALVPFDGDFLMLVEADFSYGEISQFIDSRINYRVYVTSDLQPLTATVTIDDNNDFDLWRQGKTNDLVGHNCPDGLNYGCSGNFVRIYAAPSARWIGGSDFDGHAEHSIEQKHMLFGNFMLLLPGEYRPATMMYAPGGATNGGEYHLYVQKQPGTVARPLHFELHTAGGHTFALDTDLQTDREIVVGWRAGHLTLLSELPPNHPQNTPERLAARGGFFAGWAEWQAGRREQAQTIWSSQHAFEYVIDRANMLVVQGDAPAALALATVSVQLAPDSARAAFALGWAARASQQTQQAIHAFQRSLELDPTNKQTREQLAGVLKAAEAQK